VFQNRTEFVQCIVHEAQHTQDHLEGQPAISATCFAKSALSSQATGFVYASESDGKTRMKFSV
jgi:hypothetical protein